MGKPITKPQAPKRPHWVHVSRGNYNMLDPSEVSDQYTIHAWGYECAPYDADGYSVLSVTVRADECLGDERDVPSLVREIVAIHERYLYSGKLRDLRALSAYLDSTESENDVLYWRYVEWKAECRRIDAITDRDNARHAAENAEHWLEAERVNKEAEAGCLTEEATDA